MLRPNLEAILYVLYELVKGLCSEREVAENHFMIHLYAYDIHVSIKYYAKIPSAIYTIQSYRKIQNHLGQTPISPWLLAPSCSC